MRQRPGSQYQTTRQTLSSFPTLLGSHSPDLLLPLPEPPLQDRASPQAGGSPSSPTSGHHRRPTTAPPPAVFTFLPLRRPCWRFPPFASADCIAPDLKPPRPSTSLAPPPQPSAATAQPPSDLHLPVKHQPCPQPASTTAPPSSSPRNLHSFHPPSTLHPSTRGSRTPPLPPCSAASILRPPSTLTTNHHPTSATITSTRRPPPPKGLNRHQPPPQEKSTSSPSLSSPPLHTFSRYQSSEQSPELPTPAADSQAPTTGSQASRPRRPLAAVDGLPAAGNRSCSPSNAGVPRPQPPPVFSPTAGNLVTATGSRSPASRRPSTSLAGAPASDSNRYSHLQPAAPSPFRRLHIS